MAGKRKVYEESIRMAANFSWDQDWPNALKAYRAALQEFPNDAEALVGLGAAYSELQQYQSAIRAIQRALASNPTNQNALEKMADVLEKMERFDEATKTYLYAANLQSKAGEMDKAIETWNKVLKINPEHIQSRNYLAQTYAKQGKTKEAVSELIELGITFQEKGDEKMAGQYLNGAARLAPDDPRVASALKALDNGVSIRMMQQNISQFKDIQAEIDGTTEEPEDYDDFFKNFGDDEEETAYNPREEVQQAAKEELANILFEDDSNYENVSFDKMEIGLLVTKALTLETKGESAQAIETYEKIIQMGFQRPSIYFVLASLYVQTNQPDKASHYFNLAKKEPSYLLGVNFALGEGYKVQNDANQALKHFVEVLRIIDLKNARRESTSELNQLYQALVQNYMNANDNERTLAFVDSLINFLSSKHYEKNIIEARRRLGASDGASVSNWIEFLESSEPEVILTAMAKTGEYMKRNMILTAIETCYMSIQKVPSYLPLHLRLAEIYMKKDSIESSIKKYLAVARVYNIRGNLTQEAAIYEKVLKVAPMDINVRTNLIDLYQSQNNIDSALEQYEVLADAYYQLAQVNQALDKYKEAFQLSSKATNPVTWQSKILHSMGDIYNQRVDWKNATDMYEQLVRINPQDDRATKSLIDLYFKRGQSKNALAILDKMMANYVKQGKQKELLEYMEDLTQLRPGERSLHEKLGAFYAHLKMNKEAIAQYDILGEMQLEIGLRDDAARTIQRIIQLGPEDPTGYQQLLAQIKGGI